MRSRSTWLTAQGCRSPARLWLDTTPNVELHPVDRADADAFTTIDRAALADPWDRFIVATAVLLGVPLVTPDARIVSSGIVPTIW
jgi:PIN domain nuclease of toxin-antitoxin system